MGKLIDLTGKIFGRLIVLERAENGKLGATRWHCRCSCGKTTTIYSSHLSAGRTKSCGCYQRTAKITHGMSGHKAYRVWYHMLERCENPKHPSWNDYGGRGISVCNKWKTSFSNFWTDMGDTYKKGLSIDRIDNDRGYSPDNCRWATRSQQQNNIRMNKRNTSGYRGMNWNKAKNKWRASVREARKTKHIGYFSDKIEAAQARDNYIAIYDLPAQLSLIIGA